MVRDASRASLPEVSHAYGSAPEILLVGIRQLGPDEGGDLAELSPAQIEGMSIPELAVVVRESRLPLDERVADALELYDAETLRRMAHLARRCCQGRHPRHALPSACSLADGVH